MNVLDDQVSADLTRIYRQAVSDLEQDVNEYAEGNRTVRLDVLQNLLAQARARLTQLERAKLDLMDRAFIAAAQLGVQPFAEEAVVVGANLTGLANDAVQFVRNFVAEDGLQLSDRIWRNDRHARRVVQEAIEQAVIQGHSAAQAAEDFLSRGMAVPADVQRKMGAASADRIAGQIGSSVMRGEGAPFDNAIRLFRTEINRAHGEAYQATAFEHPDVIGTRFLLSPNHPKTDICCRAGTPVATDKGAVNIESIGVGDRVLTHTGRYQPVLKVYQNPLRSDELVRLTFQAGNNHSRQVELTPNHPVLTPLGWVPAGDLETGSLVQTARCADLDLLADDVRCKAAQGSAQNSNKPASKKAVSARYDAPRQRQPRTPHIAAEDSRAPTYARMLDSRIFQHVSRHLSIEDYRIFCGFQKGVSAFLRSGKTFLSFFCHSWGCFRRAWAHILENNTFDFLSKRQMAYGTSGTLLGRMRESWYNMPASKKRFSDLLFCRVEFQSLRHNLGTWFQFFFSLPQQHIHGCKTVSWSYDGRAPIGLASDRGVSRKIRNTSWLTSRCCCSENDNNMLSRQSVIAERLKTDVETVYNLAVAKDHSYIANGLVVHNCDMHARVNRWGLGPGVYPKGKNPWPAHPNTLSFVEVVFDDEVSKKDRAGKENRIEWLNQQSPDVQEAVLNSRKKGAALDRGILIEGQIATPWKVLKKRFERRGIDTDELS